MTRYSKLGIAVVAFAVTALAMIAAVHLAATFLTVAEATARRHPGFFVDLTPFLGVGIAFSAIALGWHAKRRRAAIAPGDRWAQLRERHTRLAERILPPA